nr:hypothetical protein [Candidatus Njordarchaeota archaeon]
MAPETEESRTKQTDLEGKPARRGKIKYRKLFSKHSRRKKQQAAIGQYRAESEAEGKIIEWLKEHGIAFESHGAIPQASSPVDANRLLEGILSSFNPEDRELLITRLRLKKIDNNRSIGRYDFKIEGFDKNTGKFETYYVEYWGMYNPSLKITKENMRRLYNRLLANYTLIKKPLKEKYYQLMGLNLISLTRAELKKQVLDEKLGCLLNLDQKHLISRYMPEK